MPLSVLVFGLIWIYSDIAAATKGACNGTITIRNGVSFYRSGFGDNVVITSKGGSLKCGWSSKEPTDLPYRALHNVMNEDGQIDRFYSTRKRHYLSNYYTEYSDDELKTPMADMVIVGAENSFPFFPEPRYTVYARCFRDSDEDDQWYFAVRKSPCMAWPETKARLKRDKAYEYYGKYFGGKDELQKKVVECMTKFCGYDDVEQVMP